MDSSSVMSWDLWFVVIPGTLLEGKDLINLFLVILYSYSLYSFKQYSSNQIFLGIENINNCLAGDLKQSRRLHNDLIFFKLKVP
jgi:hypothetical protein